MTLVSVIQEFENKTSRKTTLSESSVELPLKTRIDLNTPQTPDIVITMRDNKNQYFVAEVKTFDSSHTDSLLTPTRPWKAAVSGTVTKYAGILSDKIPALRKISDKELDQDIDEMRK